MVTYSKGAESPITLWITNIFYTRKLRNLLSSEAYVGNAVAEKQSIKGPQRLSQGFMLYLFAYLSSPTTFLLCVPDWGASWLQTLCLEGWKWLIASSHTPQLVLLTLFCQSSEKRCCPPLGLLLSQVLLSSFSKERTSVSQTREGSQQQCTLAVGFRRREGTELFHVDILTSWACGSRRWICMCC